MKEIKKKWSLTSLTKNEISKKEMKSTLAGKICWALCHCTCVLSIFTDSSCDSTGENDAQNAYIKK